MEQRAALAVAFARELLGDEVPADATALYLPLTVGQFDTLFRARYAEQHPELVFRSDSSTERARLERRGLPHLPRVILRQGAPRTVDRLLTH
jgi:hypothetical protein